MARRPSRCFIASPSSAARIVGLIRPFHLIVNPMATIERIAIDS